MTVLDLTLPFQWKRASAEWWDENNPVLAVAEPGYDKDAGRFKLGDGVTAWQDLPYYSVGGSGGGNVDTVNDVLPDITGNVELSAGDVGADPAGIASSLVTAETSRATGAETAEVTRATGAEDALNAAIGAETSRAEAAEGTLASGITSEAGTRAASVTNLQNGLTAETSRAEAAEGGKVSKSGDTMTGTLQLSGDPVDPLQAATKQYVDALAGSGLVVHPFVQVVSVANQGSLSGLPVIDGYQTLQNDRVLLVEQSTASQNGIWQVGSGAWSRPADFSTGSNAEGSYVFVSKGSTNGATGWVLTTTGVVTVDTTNEAWTQFSAATNFAQGLGISIVGATINNAGVVSVAVSGGGLNFFFNPTTGQVTFWLDSLDQLPAPAGPLGMASEQIQNLADATHPQDAVTLSQMEAAIAPDALPLPSNTLSILGSGVPLDDITLVMFSTNQTTLTINGPAYSVSPGDGVLWRLRITSTSVCALTWNSAFHGSAYGPLPAQTSGGGKTDYLSFIVRLVGGTPVFDFLGFTPGFS